jgi:thiol-disulfide isomerase/thioredoxin
MAWIKGTPVKQFKRGKVYVLEYFATWCAPCRAEMPRLSALAGQYRNKAIFIGIDLFSAESISFEKVKRFVDSIGNRMDYAVTAQDSIMAAAWREAAGEQGEGIPQTFVIDAKGRLAWVGHPMYLDTVLRDIVNNTWNIKTALKTRNTNRHLRFLDNESMYQILDYCEDPLDSGNLGKPDSILVTLGKIVAHEPRLKYAPSIAGTSFIALLKTDPHKAYEYGKEVILTPSYEEPAAHLIAGAVRDYENRLKLPPEIFSLAAEATQIDIDQIVYPENVDVAKKYNMMAAWYWRANETQKAIAAQQKAIATLKTQSNFTIERLAALEKKLEEYATVHLQ